MTTDATKQAVARYWGGQADVYDAEDAEATENEEQAWQAALDQLAPPGRALDVLDVACGTGFLALRLAARGHRVTGCDLAPEMVERTRANAATHGLSITLLLNDAEALADVPDAAFDLVVSRLLVWTLPNPNQAVQTWMRVVRPGGRVAAIDGEFGPTPNKQIAEGYGAAVMDALPNSPRNLTALEAEELFRRNGLRRVRSEYLHDLMAALRARVGWAIPPQWLVFGERP